MSEIRATTISDAAGTGPIALTKQSAAKAHAFISLTFVAESGSFNVSSVEDVTTGSCSVNLTAAMANGTYTVQSNSAQALTMATSYPVSESQYNVRMFNTSGTFSDRATMSSTHGDLA